MPEDSTPSITRADEIAKAVTKMTVTKINRPTVTISTARMTAVQAMFADLTKAAINVNGMTGSQPAVMAALAKAASASNLKSMIDVGGILESQRAMASVRAMEQHTSKVPSIAANPLIGMAREQIELQERANEALAKNNDSLGRVIAALETELVESREETKTSRRYTKIALIIAAVGVIVSVALGIAALIK